MDDPIFFDKPCWRSAYRAWRSSSRLYGSELAKGPAFTEIKPLPPGGDQIGEAIDWWPTSEVNKRRNNLNRFGLGGIYWETQKGLFHTANMLWDAQNEPEVCAAIWIAASTRNLSKLAERGSVAIEPPLIYELMDYADAQLGEYELWHHLHRPLPFTVFTHPYTGKLLQTEDLDQLAGLIALENVLIHSSWSLVHVVGGASGVAAVK